MWMRVLKQTADQGREMTDKGPNLRVTGVKPECRLFPEPVIRRGLKARRTSESPSTASFVPFSMKVADRRVSPVRDIPAAKL